MVRSSVQIAHTIESHHEQWNGNGYPLGISGKKIPLCARIVSLCDVFDALTSRRPYKTPYPIDISCDVILKSRGKEHDPELVDILLKHISSFTAV